MSDKPKKEKEEAKDGAAAEKPAGGGFMTKLPVLLGGVMIIEAVVLFAATATGQPACCRSRAIT